MFRRFRRLPRASDLPRDPRIRRDIGLPPLISTRLSPLWPAWTVERRR